MRKKGDCLTSPIFIPRHTHAAQLLGRMDQKDKDRLAMFKISAKDIKFHSTSGMLGKGRAEGDVF